MTHANAVIFDAANDFRGCIPGIHEVLVKQGILAGRWCLDPHEELSPGQGEEIARICKELGLPLAELSKAVYGESKLPARVRESVRMRIAQINQCPI